MLTCGVGEALAASLDNTTECLLDFEPDPYCLLQKPGTKTKKMMYTLTESEDFDREEVATYEEVARLFPRAGRFRPIVLVGPPGVGRNEIKRRIIAMEPDRYRSTIPRKFINYSPLHLLS